MTLYNEFAIGEMSGDWNKFITQFCGLGYQLLLASLFFIFLRLLITFLGIHLSACQEMSDDCKKFSCHRYQSLFHHSETESDEGK